MIFEMEKLRDKIFIFHIASLVGFLHAGTDVPQKEYFTTSRFNEGERVLHILNGSDAEIISAHLGIGIPSESGVSTCQPHNQENDSVCLEWSGQTRLNLEHTKHESLDCYHITWQSLNPSFNPKDCFDWSQKRGHWYGGGQITNMTYPLERSKIELNPFITGDIQKHSFGTVLKRYFLNSKGAAIMIDDETPLYVSINANDSEEFCLQASYDNAFYNNDVTPLPQLNYSICTTDNMKNLHSTMTEKYLWDGVKPIEFNSIHTLLTEPVYQITASNETDVYNYIEDLIGVGFLKQGNVLLSEEWQSHQGDFVPDSNRFPSLEEIIHIMHRRGFRITLTIQPFISTESMNFEDAKTKGLFISKENSDTKIPAITRYMNTSNVAVLDITNNETLPWILGKLNNLITKYNIDSFYLDLGTAHDIPHDSKSEHPLTNPDQYKTMFSKAISNSVPVMGISGAVYTPKAAVFVSLPPCSSSWESIKTVIPTILNYGIVGYSLVIPGTVGGDAAPPMTVNNSENHSGNSLPEKELYVRWLQLSTFLPVIKFSHLPKEYMDSTILDMARNLTRLRQETVTPLLEKYANVSLDLGLPIIRPLWMLDLTDPTCYVIGDQFSVGEELIVAPILDSGSRKRDIYLPDGVWRDEIDGSSRKGSKWIHDYEVGESQIAHFTKMTNDQKS